MSIKTLNPDAPNGGAPVSADVGLRMILITQRYLRW